MITSGWGNGTGSHMSHKRIFLALAVALVPQLASADEAIPWTYNVEQAFEQAQRENKLVLLHFWHEQCGPCRRLDNFVFKDGKVGAAVSEDYIAVKINTRENPDVARRYRINSVPQDLVFRPNGEIVSQRISPSNSRGYLFMLSQVVKTAGSPRGGSDVAMARAMAYNDPTEIPVIQGRGPQPAFPEQRRDGSGLRLSDGTNRQAMLANASSNNARGQAPTDPTRMGSSQQPQAPRGQVQQLQGSPGAGRSATSERQVVENPFVQQRGNVDPARNPAMSNSEIQRAGYNQANAGASDVTLAQGSGGGAFQPPGAAANQPSGRFAPQKPQANVANRAGVGRPPVQPIAPQAIPQQSQAEQPPLGLEGFCPITLIEKRAWEAGDKRFGCLHRGQLYLFNSIEARDRFLQEPDRFSPILSGYDPVIFAERGELVVGKREHGRFIDDRIVLFASEESFTKFAAAPMQYIVVVREAMQSSEQVRR